MNNNNTEGKQVNIYFRKVYPNERYQLKKYSVIHGMFNNTDNDLFVIEFIDTKMIHPKTLELQVKRNDLYNINIK